MSAATRSGTDKFDTGKRARARARRRRPHARLCARIRPLGPTEIGRSVAPEGTTLRQRRTHKRELVELPVCDGSGRVAEEFQGDRGGVMFTLSAGRDDGGATIVSIGEMAARPRGEHAER
jgi:hypothetical protein